MKITPLLLLLLLLLFVTLSLSSKAETFDVSNYLNKTYITIGTGYKFDELAIHFTDKNGEKYNWNDRYSARIEIGYNYSKNVKFGISHHSQWATGFPFHGQKNEYYKTELFIDYTFNLGELL